MTKKLMMMFAAVAAAFGATVTASGLPEGMKLVKLDAGDGGALGDRALPGFAMYGFSGFTEKSGTYLVTVKYRMRLTMVWSI